MSFSSILRNSAMICATSVLRCPVNPPIGQALSADALKRNNRAFGIAESGLLPLAVNFNFGFAVVVAEIKFCGIALQMLRTDMVKRADDPAFENREVAFRGIANVSSARCINFGTDKTTQALVEIFTGRMV